jgi:hypothetical protein
VEKGFHARYAKKGEWGGASFSFKIDDIFSRNWKESNTRHPKTKIMSSLSIKKRQNFTIA